MDDVSAPIRPSAPAHSGFDLARQWWHTRIGEIDRASVVERVDSEAGWSSRYAFMAMMSAGIAVLGLLLSSPAVVIGAMLISPLMGPIIGLGFALAIFDWREVRRSVTALAIGSGLAVAFCALIVLMSPLQAVTEEILARTRPNLFDLLVAVFSALAGSYAMIRGRGETIVGVAIATALMPPLAVVGYGLATWNMPVFGGAAALFLTNLIAIALSAAFMARLYGFGAALSPEQTRVQAASIVVVLMLLSVPLALSLRHIAWEAIAARQVRSTIENYFPDTARVSQLDIDFGSDPPSASAIVLTDRYRPVAEREVSARLAEVLGSEVRLHLNQLIVDQDLSRLEQEREALAKSASAQAQINGQADDIAATVGLLAGVDARAITIDRTSRHALVVARPVAAMSLTAWRTFETRLGARYAGWQIEVVPPLVTLPRIGFASGSATLSPQGAASVATIGWALQRWRIADVAVIGRAASSGEGDGTAARRLAQQRADAVADRLVSMGVRTHSSVDPAGPIQRAAERETGLAAFRSVEVKPVEPALPPAPPAVEPADTPIGPP